MKKRWVFLGILALVLLVSIVLVFRLSFKNNTLRYILDDTRQIELLKELSTSIFEERINREDIKIEYDSEFFLNFVNNTAYVTSNKEELFNKISSYSNDKSSTVYTISLEFNTRKRLLTISLTPKNEEDETYTFNYKLKKGKDNTIKYKEKK